MKCFFSIFFSVLTAIGFAETNSVKGPVQMILPINWTSSPEYNLIVSIPKGYTSLQDLESFEKATLIEFVPSGENGTNWSEIITIHKMIGEKVSANVFVQKFKTALLEKTTHGRILKDTYETFPNYEKATLFISYDDGQHEILGAEYYSGPFDCVGIQYTIRDQHDKKAVAKIEKFFKTLILNTQEKEDKS